MAIFRRHYGLLVLIAITPTWLLQCEAIPAQLSGTIRPLQVDGSPNVFISPGDLLSVTVFDSPEMSREVRVSGDGKIKLPLLEDQLRVANLNETQASLLIDKVLTEHSLIRYPHTSVLIREFASRGISVLGEVVHPGLYPVQGPRSVLDMIAMAGGLTPIADTRVTIKHVSGSVEQTSVSLPADDAAKTLAADVEVSVGDKIIAPRAGTIYVLGDVGRPGGYLMQYNGHLTVLQAIAQANGTTKTSSEHNAFLIRRTGESYTTTVVSLRAMFKGKTPDLTLQANDVLFVPTSNLRNFEVNAPGILGSLAGAAIYSVNR